MSGRRVRPPTRHSTRSVEPVVVKEKPAQQTRRNTRRNKAFASSAEMPEPQAPSKRATRSSGIVSSDAVGLAPPPIAQRGTRRKPRRSLESVATGDFNLKSSGDKVSSEPEGDPEPEVQEEPEEEPEVEPQDGDEEEPEVDRPENERAGARESQTPASMVEHNESVPERDARIQALLEIGVPDFLHICRQIHGQLKAIGDETPSVTEAMKLKVFQIPYDAWRTAFAGDSTRLFIDFDETPFGLISSDDAISRDKARTAVYSGNLVALLRAILNVQNGKLEPTPMLQQLDDAFPILFYPSSQDWSDLLKDTFDLAFHIRCRCLIELFARSPQRQSMLGLAANMFCVKSDADTKKPLQYLEEGPYRQLAGIDMNVDHEPLESFQSQMKRLLMLIARGPVSTMQDLLDETYSQETLLADLKAWAMTRLDQLTVPAATSNGSCNLGGSESLFVDAVESRQDSSDSGSEIESQDVHIPTINGPGGSFFDGSATLADVRRGVSVSERPGIVPPSNQQAAKGKQKAFNLQDAVRRLDSARVLSTLDDRDGSISSNVPQGSSSALRPAPTSSRATTSKRQRPPDFDDDDDVSEPMKRFADRSGRVQSSHDTPRASPKRPRLAHQPPASSLEQVREHPRLPQPSVPPGERLQERHLMTLSQDVRNIKRDLNASRTRQARVPWSSRDTDRLIELIAYHRCSWSAIAKEGGFEVPRDQQAVRDRARNLKVLFLSGDKLLPSCFNMIALGQKERDAIIRVRRNPDRREDDVDERGNVINHIWVE